MAPAAYHKARRRRPGHSWAAPSGIAQQVMQLPSAAADRRANGDSRPWVQARVGKRRIVGQPYFADAQLDSSWASGVVAQLVIDHSGRPMVLDAVFA